MKQKVKTKSQTKVLVISAILAILIVAGATFAWFTSTDEVTNKLTAQSNYGVSIVEDFTPPGNWTPGQVVNKDVSLVNTGNVAAIVKASLTSEMTLTYKTTGEAYNSANTANYVTLSTDEVKAAQAGGRLVYTMKKDSTEATVTPTPALTSDAEEIAYGTAFTPTYTGLYIFERTEDSTESSGSITTEYTYSGYYYVQNDESSPAAGSGTYYELDTITPTKSSDTLTGFTATLVKTATKQIEDTTSGDNLPSLTYDFTSITSANESIPYIKVTYTAVTEKPIVIKINLDKSYATSWTWNASEKAFYYNDDLEPGTTTQKLIDSIELDSSVSNDAYISFDYSLNVKSDSVQVVTDEDGKETVTAVTSSNSNNSTWKLTPVANYETSGDTNEIKSITWSTQGDEATSSGSSSEASEVTVAAELAAGEA